MRTNPFVTFLGATSSILSVIGIIFFFINPFITFLCAIFSLFNSVIQICFGDQNNFNTEISTIIIGLIISLIIKQPILKIVSMSVCIADILFLVLGWITMFLFYKKRF